MTRREFVNGTTTLAIAARLGDYPLMRLGFIAGRRSSPEQFGNEAFPAGVAGVRLVNSNIARAATQLTRSVSPPYLFNHAVRTFLFGSLIGRALGQRFDKEVLYLACILHDLGLTE